MYNQFKMNVSPSNIGKIGESVFGESMTKLPQINTAHKTTEVTIKVPRLQPFTPRKSTKKKKAKR